MFYPCNCDFLTQKVNDRQWRRQKFLPAGHYRGTIISNGAHFTVAQRPRKACKPGPFFKPVFPVSEYATNSTCLCVGCSGSLAL